MSLAFDWTKHIKDPKQKEDFAKTVRNSTLILTRIYDLLSEREASLDQQEISDDYSSPSWSHLQADRIGRRKELHYLKQLLENALGKR